MEKNTKNNANRMQTTLTFARTRVLPVVVSNFRNKLIGVVLAGLVLPQMAYAGHGGGGGGGGNKGGGHHSGGHHSSSNHSGGNSSSRSMQHSSNSNKSFSQKSSNFQNGGQKQFAKKSSGQPIPAKNGNTGINGSGLPDRVVPFKNGNTGFTGIGKPKSSQHQLSGGGITKGGKISGGGKVAEVNTVKSNQSWKQFRDSAVSKKPSKSDTLTDTGIRKNDLNKVFTKKPSSPTGPIVKGDVVKPIDKFDLKTRKDFDKYVNVGGGKGPGKADPGTGGGKGKGNGKGDGKHHHHHGFPWWAFVTPVVGYPSYPGYNNGYCQSGIYQQPVYNNAPVYAEAPIVDQAPVTPVNYPAPTEPAGATAPSQPVKGNSDGYVDLVLEDVEYLEPATVTVGPLYLVKVRNQGTKLSEKFRIGAFAQLEGELSDDAPRSVTEVPNLGAGELASVTLRLPAAAMKLISTSSAGSAAFNQLLVVVDLDDTVVEIEKSNNVANLDRAALEAAAATH